MKHLTLQKSEFHFLMISAALIPLFSFIAGFFLASNNSTQTMPNAIKPTQGQQEKLFNISSLEPKSKEKDISSVESIALTNQQEIKSVTNVEPAKTEQKATNDVSQSPLFAAEPKYIIQAGRFSKIDNARKMSAILTTKGINNQIIDDSTTSPTTFRVVTGTYRLKETARVQLQRLQKAHTIRLFLTTTTLPKKASQIALL
ncbi:SPOR domain-containing protein [Aliikangiella maris]|uniref:SPOR domain-containing protein n=2 Tax=Aliikangiella maris TaxID=3162458 RepID=A0ABV3MMI3_9GAMM